MISKEEVIKIAKLARLELSEEEIGKMQKDLSAVLEYFDTLKKVKGKREKVKGSVVSENMTRKDEAVKKNPNLAGDLIEAAPEKKEGYIKVKTVF